jgi:hypothetical protein
VFASTNTGCLYIHDVVTELTYIENWVGAVPSSVDGLADIKIQTRMGGESRRVLLLGRIQVRVR